MLIGELAARTNTTKDTIRLYEGRGYITSRPVKASSRIYRDYSDDTIDTIASIRQARTMGVPLKDWKVFYDEWSKKDLTNIRRRELLAGEILKIRSQIKQLRGFEKLMLKKIEEYSA